MSVALSVLPLHSLDQHNQTRCYKIFWSFDATGAGVRETWYWHCHQWHYCICYVNTIKLRCNITFFVIWCCWKLVSALSMAPLYLLGQDNQDEVQHDIWSHDTFSTGTGDSDNIINAASALPRLRCLNWCPNDFADPSGTFSTQISITWCQWCCWQTAPLHYVDQDIWNEVQHDFLVMW